MEQAEFDRFADAYAAQHAENIAITGEGPEYFAEYKVADMAKHAKLHSLDPKTILDFGAGIGNSVPYFTRYFPKSKQIAADVSSKSLEILRTRFKGAAETVLITDRIPLPDESVDYAFTACVFHHIPEKEHLHWLTEVRRVVRPGGMFVLFEHNPLNPLTVRAVNTCPFDENAVLIRSHEMRKRFIGAGWQSPRKEFRIFFPAFLKQMRPIEPGLKWLPFGGQYSLRAVR